MSTNGFANQTSQLTSRKEFVFESPVARADPGTTSPVPGQTSLPWSVDLTHRVLEADTGSRE